MDSTPAWIGFVFAVAFALALPLVIFATLAVMSGWKDLAMRFPDVDSGDDSTRAFGSAAFARGRFPVRFNNAIWIRTTMRGVRFWTLLGPVTFGTMRPFFLPWVEIERVERRKELFGESLKLHIRGFGGSITLVGRLAKAFAAAWKEPA